MVGIISSGFRSITMDGSVDVPTPATLLMWKSILDTFLRTIGSDQLCPYPCHKVIQGKAVYPGHCWTSFARTYVWPTRASSFAQSNDTIMERSTQDEIGSYSQRMHSGIYCLERTEDRGCSSSSSQDVNLSSRSCSHTTIRSRDCQIRVYFREVGNGTKVSETPGSGR